MGYERAARQHLGSDVSTTADLVSECERYLYAGTREQHNRLEGAHDASTTTFTFEFDVTFSAGVTLAVDLEVVYVWSVTSTTAVVERGWAGSTAAAHADAAIVTVNPKFSKFSILEAINSDLADLSSPVNGLFQMKTVELTYNSAIRGYNLTSVTDLLDVYEVRYDETGPSKTWPRVKSWTLKRLSETDDFASGNALVLHEPGQSGQQLRVLYKAPFASLTALADNVQTVAGLSTYADDIPSLGAAFRLLSVREGARNFFEVQGETRRAEEVPPGAQLRGASGLVGLRQDRVVKEAARLSQQFPEIRR